MHELAIISNLLEIVKEEASAHRIHRVTRVDLVIGKMHHLVPDLVRFAFETITEGTVAEQADLEIEWVEVMMTCRDCTHHFQLDDWVFICPKCGSVDLKQVCGQELYVKSLEGEDNGNHDHEKGDGPESEPG